MYIISSSSNQNVVYAVKNGEEKKIQQYGNEGVEATYYCLWYDLLLHQIMTNVIVTNDTIAQSLKL